MVDRGDTIFALASARGRAGVAVFRLSGPASADVARRLCGTLPAERRAALRTLSWAGETIDEALVLVFGDGASFTGEPTVELHTHGSPAVIRRLESVLSEMPGCRLAAPGEFTRRALENGRMDLTQVEGLADLIDAETEAQLRQARRAFAGEFGRRIESWRADLLRVSALVEASIDFADEGLPDVMPEAAAILRRLTAEWQAEIAGSLAVERLRDGFEVALVGAPNSGKSTIINKIADRDVAITSRRAGTTRDVIEVRTELGGLPVTFLDTAGLRQTDDDIEAVGVERSRARAAAADLRLLLGPDLDGIGVEMREGDVRLHGKCDLGRGPGLNVSGRTGEGIETLLSAVSDVLADRTAGNALASRDRHRQALRLALDHLAGDGATPELMADDLRAARTELDVLLGRVDVEDILGHIFASFCIGK